MLTARRGDRRSSYHALRIADSAAPFVSWDSYYYHIHITWLLCALHLGDVEQARQELRWLTRAMPFESSVYRLWNAIQSLSQLEDRKGYSDKSHMQVFRRQIRLMDFALASDESRRSRKYTAEDRTAALDPRKFAASKAPNKREGNPYGITKPNVELLILFGNLLAANGSHREALVHYKRAFRQEAKEQKRPSSYTAFLVAVAYSQCAAQKTCEGRSGCAAEAARFFGIYKKLRLSLVDERGRELPLKDIQARRQEVAFNEGRLHHGLGKFNTAISCYERCLAVKENPQRADTLVPTAGLLKRKRDDTWVALDADGELSMRDEDNDQDDNDDDSNGAQDFKQDAAAALQQLLATTGNMQKARDITDRWLVFPSSAALGIMDDK